METTLQPSLHGKPSFRTKITTIEASELCILAFGFWSLLALIPGNTSQPGFIELIIFFAITEGGILGSWVIYNIYIRIARAGGRRVDVALWVIASAITGSYTFWTWTILDINRWLMAKLFYQGEAPVEYAWSARSKLVRKVWEQTQKAASAS